MTLHHHNPRQRKAIKARRRKNKSARVQRRKTLRK